MIRLDTVFQEPLLEFGNAGLSPDIRDGIARNGPVGIGTAKAKTSLRLGFVGTPKTVHAFSDWFKQCSNGLNTDDPLNQNFSPGFPGLAADTGLRCAFLTDPSWVVEIVEGELKELCKKTGAVLGLAELFYGHIRGLFDLTAAKPDVVLCLPPENVRKRVKPHLGDEEDGSTEGGDDGEPDFHDYLKGLCLQTRSLVQLAVAQNLRPL